MDRLTTAGRPCELLIIGTATAPGSCASSAPQARRTARIVRNDRDDIPGERGCAPNRIRTPRCRCPNDTPSPRGAATRECRAWPKRHNRRIGRVPVPPTRRIANRRSRRTAPACRVRIEPAQPSDAHEPVPERSIRGPKRQPKPLHERRLGPCRLRTPQEHRATVGEANDARQHARSAWPQHRSGPAAVQQRACARPGERRSPRHAQPATGLGPEHHDTPHADARKGHARRFVDTRPRVGGTTQQRADDTVNDDSRYGDHEAPAQPYQARGAQRTVAPARDDTRSETTLRTPGEERRQRRAPTPGNRNQRRHATSSTWQRRRGVRCSSSAHRRACRHLVRDPMEVDRRTVTLGCSCGGSQPPQAAGALMRTETSHEAREDQRKSPIGR